MTNKAYPFSTKDISIMLGIKEESFSIWKSTVRKKGTLKFGQCGGPNYTKVGNHFFYSQKGVDIILATRQPQTVLSVNDHYSPKKQSVRDMVFNTYLSYKSKIKQEPLVITFPGECYQPNNNNFIENKFIQLGGKVIGLERDRKIYEKLNDRKHKGLYLKHTDDASYFYNLSQINNSPDYQTNTIDIVYLDYFGGWNKNKEGIVLLFSKQLISDNSIIAVTFDTNPRLKCPNVEEITNEIHKLAKLSGYKAHCDFQAVYNNTTEDKPLATNMYIGIFFVKKMNIKSNKVAA